MRHARLRPHRALPHRSRRVLHHRLVGTARFRALIQLRHPPGEREPGSAGVRHAVGDEQPPQTLRTTEDLPHGAFGRAFIGIQAAGRAPKLYRAYIGVAFHVIEQIDTRKVYGRNPASQQPSATPLRPEWQASDLLKYARSQPLQQLSSDNHGWSCQGLSNLNHGGQILLQRSLAVVVMWALTCGF